MSCKSPIDLATSLNPVSIHSKIVKFLDDVDAGADTLRDVSDRVIIS